MFLQLRMGAGELEEDLWCARKIVMWRGWWFFYNDDQGLDQAITRIVSRVSTAKYTESGRT